MFYLPPACWRFSFCFVLQPLRCIRGIKQRHLSSVSGCSEPVIISDTCFSAQNTSPHVPPRHGPPAPALSAHPHPPVCRFPLRFGYQSCLRDCQAPVSCAWLSLSVSTFMLTVPDRRFHAASVFLPVHSAVFHKPGTGKGFHPPLLSENPLTNTGVTSTHDWRTGSDAGPVR